MFFIYGTKVMHLILEVISEVLIYLGKTSFIDSDLQFDLEI